MLFFTHTCTNKLTKTCVSTHLHAENMHMHTRARPHAHEHVCSCPHNCRCMWTLMYTNWCVHRDIRGHTWIHGKGIGGTRTFGKLVHCFQASWNINKSVHCVTLLDFLLDMWCFWLQQEPEDFNKIYFMCLAESSCFQYQYCTASQWATKLLFFKRAWRALLVLEHGETRGKKLCFFCMSGVFFDCGSQEEKDCKYIWLHFFEVCQVLQWRLVATTFQSDAFQNAAGVQGTLEGIGVRSEY